MSPADEAAELKMDSTLLRILPSKLEQRLSAQCWGAFATCRVLALSAEDEAPFMFQFMREAEIAERRRPKKRGCASGRCVVA